MLLVRLSSEFICKNFELAFLTYLILLLLSNASQDIHPKMALHWGVSRVKYP